ncbi:MAG: chemotaxis protein CheW [SAR324 cluster bacterium]|nr:chemotaxis protein CheW [SAR324 cluster bacterium]
MAEQETQTTQYLTLTLDNEEFALDINKVREVLEVTTITKVPQMPSFMCGVINLRGSVVPVVDMRMKFGLEVTSKTVNTCIIIVEIHISTEKVVIGALVDSVREVIELDHKFIQPPPKIGTKLNTEFIKGMGKHNEGFLIILDIDKVFSQDELMMASDISETT